MSIIEAAEAQDINKVMAEVYSATSDLKERQREMVDLRNESKDQMEYYQGVINGLGIAIERLTH